VGAGLEFRHVDVFTGVPFTGNGLIVLFGNPSGVRAEALIALTIEMRQFELIKAEFQPETGRVPARIFTAEEELPFAGHPVIGAAVALHERHAAGEPARSWVFVIAGREIAVRSRRTAGYYEAEMNQGSPTLASPLGRPDAARFAGALGLSETDLHGLPMQVVSTGLPYLIVPVAQGLDRARIAVTDLEDRLASVGAKFVYVFDPDKREGRSWDNTGAVEDVATGSAAGPAAAFLAAHGLAAQDENGPHQPGTIRQAAERDRGEAECLGDLWVGGPVAPVGHGVIDQLPD
jgi:trans-2,3-dihydro-3-hydroxyanthranilate isomerase